MTLGSTAATSPLPGDTTDAMQPLWPLSLLLWSGGLILLPFYILESGRPQPAHVVLLVAAMAAFVQFRTYDEKYTIFVRALGLFVFVVAIVTVVQAMLAPSDVSLMPPLFALFNFLVVRTAVILRSHLGTRFLSITGATLAFVLIGIALLSVLATSTGLLRTSGTFNNPNQQAYFVVSAASAVTGIAFVKSFNWRIQLAAYVSSVYLLAVSNSKAGLLAMVLVVIVVALTQPRVGLTVVALVIVLVGATQIGTTIFENTQTRISKPQSDDTFKARGYHLLVEHPGYLIVGAGEGYDDRFDHTDEIHSTVGTVAFAYGIAGLVAFFAIMVQVERLSGAIGLAIIAPALVYGLAHNGLRFTIFWILIAVAASLGRSTVPGRFRRWRSTPETAESFKSL